MRKTLPQFLYGRRRAKRYRPAGVSSNHTPVVAVDPVLLAKAAVEEIGWALTAAGIWNAGSIESSPRRIEFKYRCPTLRCAQHGYEDGQRIAQIGGHGVPCAVIGALIRLENAGVMARVHTKTGAVVWSPNCQVCRHTRSGLKVWFIALEGQAS